MKQFSDFWQFMTTPLDNDWMSYVILVFIWILVLILVAWIIYGLFMIIDYSFTPNQIAMGEVKRKNFTPAHTTTSYSSINGVMIPQTHTTPDEWTLYIELNDKEDDFSVTKEYYDKVSVGNYIQVKFTTGRIDGGLYIKEIL